MAKTLSFEQETEKLEALVRGRDTHAFSELSVRFLKRHRKNRPETLFAVVDWLRRLGEAEQGYRLLDLREPLKRRTSTEDFEGKRVLWAARLLNLMGATEFALPLLEQIEPRTFDDFRIAGAIHLTHFDYHNALKYLERLEELDPDPASYASRLARLGLSDCLAGLGQRDRAAEIAGRISAASTEPLLKGIALQAQGEYLARAGKIAPALAALKEASRFFEPRDRSTDHAFLLKWLGYVLARSGEQEQGTRLLARAFEILSQTRIRPESWLDVLRLRVEAGLAPRAELERIASYPGLAPGFLALVGTQGGAEIQESASALVIDLSRDEIRQGHRVRSGVPLELRVLGYAALAGDWGISATRIKSLLWPREVYSFLQLENRLQQLFHRLRHFHHFPIRFEQGVASLPEPAASKVRVIRNRGHQAAPSFLTGLTGLKSRESFSRVDAEKYYGLSRTQATARIHEWEARGWVTCFREGRRVLYRVTPAVRSTSDT